MHSDLNAVESSISSPFFGSFLILPSSFHADLSRKNTKIFFSFFLRAPMQRREEPNGDSFGSRLSCLHIFSAAATKGGVSLIAQLPECMGHVTYGAVTAISDAITRSQTNREVRGGLVKGLL